MDQAMPYHHRLRVAHLSARTPTELSLEPDEAERGAIARMLGLSALPAVRLAAQVVAAPNGAWELAGRLTGRVVQPCVVTLAPVETAIDEPVRRLYSPHAADPSDTDAEMPDDETEPLGQSIDAGAVLVEALSLALPLYPRSPGAALPAATEDAADSAEGTRRPFAGLDRLLGGGQEPQQAPSHEPGVPDAGSGNERA